MLYFNFFFLYLVLIKLFIIKSCKFICFLKFKIKFNKSTLSCYSALIFFLLFLEIFLDAFCFFIIPVFAIFINSELSFGR